MVLVIKAKVEESEELLQSLNIKINKLADKDIKIKFKRDISGDNEMEYIY